MKQKHWIIVAIIIAAAILIYGFMNYSYKMKVLESENQTKAEEINRQEKLNRERELKLINCQYSAESVYNSTWQANCPDYGSNKKADGSCSLPTYIVNSLKDVRQNALDNCVKLYGK